MKRLIYITLIYAIGCSSVYCQSSLSDSLFAQGVELYNAGKYEICIPLFEKSLALDTVTDKTTRPQLEIYTKMWIGSALYKMGREEEAEADLITSMYHKDIPIDRRNMVEVDSLSNKARKYREKGEYKKKK